MFMVNLANLSELIIFFSPEIVGFHAGCPLKGYIIKPAAKSCRFA